jgi:peptidoglycan/LPS O-acetylase OafA/YrhL
MPLEKILPLESLRGIAAITIVIFHFWTRSFLTNNPFVNHAPLMVDFFFVLSGFVIALSYFDKIKSVEAYIIFQTKRFWRLYPLHLFMLFVFLAIECLKFLVENRLGLVANNPAFSRNNFAAFLHNIFLTQGLFLDRVTYNFPSWSISAEFYTYAIFGFIMVFGRARGILCVGMFCLSLAILLVTDIPEHSIKAGFIRCLYSFFLGVLGYWATRKCNRVLPSFVPAACIVICIVSICMLPGAMFRIFYPPVFLCIVLSFAYANPKGRVYRFFSARPLVYLGTISYSLYMTHAAVWWFFNQVMRFIFKIPVSFDSFGRTRIELDPYRASVLVCVGLVLIIGISHCTHKYIEERFKRGIRNDD